MTLTNVSPQTFDYFSALNAAPSTPVLQATALQTVALQTAALQTSIPEALSLQTSIPEALSPQTSAPSISAGYSSARALALGHLADLTYCSRRLIETTLRQDWGFPIVEFFSLGPTEAFLAADEHKIVVAFRGSDDPKDWLHNLNLGLTEGPAGGKVHRGFLTILGTVWQEMQRSICRLRAQARWQGRELALWMTGHSLGGALATLTVTHLRQAEVAIDGLYTFASPRVGDATFARHFNVDFGFRTFRIVNKNDLVPRLPLRSLRYHHVGQLHYFDRNGQRHKQSTTLFRCLDALKVHANDLFDLDFSAAENHDIGPYIDVLYGDYYQNYHQNYHQDHHHEHYHQEHDPDDQGDRSPLGSPIAPSQELALANQSRLMQHQHV